MDETTAWGVVAAGGPPGHSVDADTGGPAGTASRDTQADVATLGPVPADGPAHGPIPADGLLAAESPVAADGPVAGDDPAERLVSAALARLSLEDRVRLLTGGSFWRTRPAPAAGLRAMVLSDGPAGVRGERADEREPSASLPCPSALAATWDERLLRRVGRLLAAQARAKGVHVVLGPTVNLHRSPLGGRHFECLSEDPLLTARLGAALVRGIQAGGIAATVKHYVANESETDRFTVDVRVDERALREVYLAPFEALVREAGAWAVMAAYNGVDGATMTENPLLRDPLKDEWGFDGLVVSDWIATRSTVPAALAGLDLVMPGPWGPWGAALVAAVRAGAVPARVVEDKARRLLRLAVRVGALTEPPPERAVRGDPARSRPAVPAVPDPAVDDSESPDPARRATRPGDLGADPAGSFTRDLLRRAASTGMVLLRNAGGLLPLRAVGEPGEPRRIAVIGPNAALPRGQGGGSATVFPHHVVDPADGLRAALGGRAEVVTATGVRAEPWPAPLSTARARDPESGAPGVRVRFLDEAGQVLRSERRLSGRLMFMDDPVLARSARVEVTARLTAHTSGRHRVGFAGAGQFALRVRVDDPPAGTAAARDAVRGEAAAAAGTDVTLHDGALDPPDGDIVAAFLRPPVWWTEVELAAGADALVTLRHDPQAGLPIASFALLGEDPSLPAAAELDAAVRLAATADVAVVVVGTSDRVESEGVDRAGLDLPADQDELVRRVAAANPRTVVVVNAGAPVLLPWREDVPAVLLSWFPGQEFGAALADVLLGRVEPGGRLPTTWPARAEDCPVWSVTPADGVLRYDEGIHVGYRAWSRRAAAAAPGGAAGRGAGGAGGGGDAGLGGAEGRAPVPAYPFGHGLGYTTWVYESLDAPAVVTPGEPVRLRVTVRNCGDRVGRTVVQAYLSRADSAVERPRFWLAGFAPVDAAAGERVTITVELAPRAFQHWRSGGEAEGRAAGDSAGRGPGAVDESASGEATGPADAGGWSTEPGVFTVRVGTSSATLALRRDVVVAPR